MGSDNVKSLVLIVVGILVIVLSPWLAQNYVSSYNRILKRWLGPLTISNPHRFYLVPGIAFILIGWIGLMGHPLQPNVSRFLSLLIVAGFSMGTLGVLVSGVRAIWLFGWNSWRGLLFGWLPILAGFLGAYKIFDLIQSRPQPMVGTAVAIGLAGGAILLITVKLKWPSNPESKTRRQPSGSET